MKKRVFIGALIIAAIVILLIVAPIPTRFGHTLNAVKLDAQEQEIGTVQIPINGVKWVSLFHQDILDVTIGGFDDVLPAKVDTSEISKPDFIKFYTRTTGVVDSYLTPDGDLKSNSYTYILRMCPEFDRWLIHIRVGMDTKAYYVGSLSGNYTTEQILAYFENDHVLE